jgi:methyltransferase
LESAYRPWIAWLGWPMLTLFLAANAARWWVIRTLGARWNVEVMSSLSLGIAAKGPYRWIRHPNYSAVFVEMLALPLIHTAWITAIVGAVVHVFVLRHRVKLEESFLRRDPSWKATFQNLPRFVPRWS